MYQIKPRNIPLNDNYDVIVVGGGPSGCTAAASAAREGAKTLLIEATGCLGGMGTSGLVPAWCPFSDLEKVIYRGLAEKIFDRSKAATAHVRKTDVDWVPIDPEALKRIYDNLMEEYGVDVLFNTVLSDVDCDNGSVKAIIVTNKQGLSAYSAKTFVDTTGDADLAVFAGANYEFEQDGEPMPSTHCFVLSNVDMYGYEFDTIYGRINGGMHSNNKNSFIYELAKDDKYPDIVDTHLCNNVIGPSTVGFNAGHVFEVDATDPISVSKSLTKGRQIAFEFKNALAEYFPKAFANSYLSSTAPLMGIRESRRIVGEYKLTLDDYLNKATFEDEICRNSYYIDIHFTKAEIELMDKGEIDFEKRCARYGPGESHGIPYRSLLPKGLNNVIVAGRSIACDKKIQASVRVMPVCLSMGEAAGMAAALAATDNCNVNNINVQKLRTRLLEEGAYFL